MSIRLGSRVTLAVAILVMLVVPTFAQRYWPASDLGTLGENREVAYAINDAGQVVGSSRIGSLYSAFVWTASDGINALPNPIASAYAINNAGQVVGSSFGSSRALL
jgi:probable HAF family extracellular repeat protein